ncbi:hypothetical protein L916_11162 [Phytophthora nicotianae]|uniref:Anaphase-promoting complex subunit 1 N-terminal domain-containing protein n=1 Tax=Phytophthora nicotianae TaxID=4792 RepID=W2ISA8_PHYNI|nr:hypothetical protein L916_11162 [Phytophthora nicotianae]
MAQPSIRVHGVRANKRRTLPTDNGGVFFSESQYSSSPFLVRVTFDSVSFVHRGTHVVERRFVFPGRVLHAVLADFSPEVLNDVTTQAIGSSPGRRARKASLNPHLHPHLCVLVRSDCLNVYTAAGEVFEVALPFQANKLLPMDGRGLLLQRSPAPPIPSSSSKRPRDAAAMALARKNRRASTSNRGDGDRYKYSSGDKSAPARPRYFTLRHPLDEVKPVALSAVGGKSGDKFLSDSALEAVDVLEVGMSAVLVVFHRWEQRFCVFRMNTVQKSTSSLMPEVKVVDGPTWTRYRARSDLEELRVRIEPDWTATMLWKTPRVGPANSKPMFLSPIASVPSLLTASPVTPLPLMNSMSSTCSGNVTKVTFIASDVDGLPLLCIMDKDAGTLLMTPFSQQENATAVPGEGDNEIGSVRILHCRNAVPIRQRSQAKSCEGGEDQDFESSIDIVVLEKDGTLVLYRAHLPICRLVLPDVEQNDAGTVNVNGSGNMRLNANLQLNSICKGDAYEIVYPDLYGCYNGKIWRCEHPLKIASSPLLRQAFDVLMCIVPPTELRAFKAQVICRAQQKARTSVQADDFTSGGFEWQSFCESIIGLLPYQTVERDEALVSDGVAIKDDEMTSAVSSSSSFDALCLSHFHDVYQYEHAMLFATMELPAVEPSLSDNRATSLENMQRNEKYSLMEEYVGAIFAGLHLLCEDSKLSITLFKERLHLAELLLKMALRLKLDPFVAYYNDDHCVLQHRAVPTEKSSRLKLHSKTEDGGLLGFKKYGSVPDLVLWLKDKMTAKSHTSVEFPTLHNAVQSSGSLSRHPDNPLRRTRAICRVFELIFSSSAERDPTTQSDAFKLIVYLTQDPIGSALSLDDLPVGLSFPIVQTIRQVKHHPPPFITEDVCAFVGREDLSIASAENLTDHFDYSENQQQHDFASKTGDMSFQAEDEYRDDCDGLEDITSRSQPLFPTDQRMKEVARLLRSSRPLCLKLEKTPDLSDLDYAQQQQSRLLLLCKRSMALSVARGMVTLGSFDVSTAQTQIWRLQIPALPLQGRKPPANAIVELDLSGYAKELTYWPQFHNGCATGLRLPAQDLSGVINRHWIKYHRPSVNDTQRSPGGARQTATTQSADTTGRNLEEAYAAHAGLLLGIGLRGHLKCLSMADVYNYLSLSNEFVTVAIMLGMASTAAHCRRKRKQAAATKVGTSDDGSHASPSKNAEEMTPVETDQFFSNFSELSSSDQTPLLGTGLELALERSVSKMLCLHVPSLLPSPFGGFSVPASTQTAALLGLGILYQGTGYRLMTELLLAEIARSPSSAQFVGSNSNAGLSTSSFDQLEGYALAAGMALGLVVLGRGQTTSGDPGLADLKLEEKLHKYIVGGAQQYRDANAAGSCLYRGRRWHRFGSGGNGINAAVNGSTTGNGTPNNMASSPGAGRDTKHSSDRSGARSGGEHVNIGVTACASALALAFMYMQTNNKAVAAQLVVPDTLILLDYVRPDILLVRTLAKNLVMWNGISPTTEWIERHEVPAQLLQAYKSIQMYGGDVRGDTNYLRGSSSHSDLHSICEAYANIVAGACMSVGLRFAGTANSSARTTLRKYVLHFRELRSKASSSSSSMILRGSSSVVAAATERATIERCLAVCAQALALIDAGTGHVETLTLLRSITLRQRVDAAMSYGNHMALSMAIGLLFLGGGRATVSRSKEAIAALVISLYPMPPMNTADNKYHLQAFRHLYVLAVDTSRLLETVDVNTKRTCAVQVRVDLHPGEDDSVDDTQPSHRVHRSPCLLPEITTIERLVISDPEFYPLEILTPHSDDRTSLETGKMKTANSLRLELLRSKNVVFLKRRHRKDLRYFTGFTEELEHLHDRHEYHSGGSNDNRLRRLFRAYLMSTNGDDDDCEDVEDEGDVADWGGSWWATQLSPRALEHVRDEEQLLMPSYLNALHALFRLQQVPQLASAIEVVDLNLFSEYCCLQGSLLETLPPESKDEGKTQLVNVSGGIAEKRSSLSEFGVWLSNQTEEALSALWRRTSLDISSLASARVHLLVEPASCSSHGKRVVDRFFVSVLMRYFGGPSASSLLIRLAEQDWRTKFQRVLAACSQAQRHAGDTQSPARFQLSAFLDQDELTEAEKTFWLKLVSFFLFSN